MNQDIPNHSAPDDKHARRAVPFLDATGDRASHARALPAHARSTSSLTQGEVDFATTAGVPEDVFVTDSAATPVQDVAPDADHAATDTPSYTTAQVAEMLDCHPSSVRCALAKGRLYATKEPGQQLVYPGWQFAGSGTLPHLPEVLAALPSAYRARDVRVVMTSPLEELDGHAPQDWLATGHNPTPLLEILSELTLS